MLFQRFFSFPMLFPSPNSDMLRWQVSKMLARELQNSLFLVVLWPHLISFTYSATFQICPVKFPWHMPNSLPALSAKGFLPPVYFSAPTSQQQLGSYAQNGCSFLGPPLQFSRPPYKWVLLIAWDFCFAYRRLFLHQQMPQRVNQTQRVFDWAFRKLNCWNK